MALSRIGTLALQQMTLNNAIRVQGNLLDAQAQISSGLKASTFSELDGQVEIFSSLENRLAKSEQYIKNNAQLLSRVQTSSAALSQIVEIGNGLKNEILRRRSGIDNQSTVFGQQIDATFRALAGQLNTSLEGRYLFGGARTDTKPVADTDLPEPVELGVPDSGYYQGSNTDLAARVQDGFEVTYTVRADAEAFQQIMGAIALAEEGSSTRDDDLLSDAYDMLQDGIEGVITLQADLGTAAGAITQATEQHETQKIYWKGLKEETVGADIVALSTRLAVDQATLQATFQAFARINSLQLSDFLR